MSYLCDLFSHYHFIYITINRIILLIKKLIFEHVFKGSASGHFLAFAYFFFFFCQFQPGVDYKSVAYIKKASILQKPQFAKFIRSYF